MFEDAACSAGSNCLVLVLCISCRRTEPLFPRPHGAESEHYPFMPGAYIAWGYDEIIIYRRPNMFFNSDCAEKENLWGDMFIKIKKVIYIYTRRWPGEDECTKIYGQLPMPSINFEAWFF